MARQHWLVKQEPDAYGWPEFQRDGTTAWTGVRNFQARNNLRAMNKGDPVAYYHTGTEKRVVGVARVVRESYADPTAHEGDWSAIDLAAVKALKSPVTLEQIKADPVLREMPLVKQSRLSVMPLSELQFKRLLELGETGV